MKTKSLVRFLARAAYLDADIELADVVKISIGKGALTIGGGPYVFDYVNPKQHPRLASRASTIQSRRLAINHLKATLCAAFLKDTYEDVTQYFLEILEGAARNGLDPNRLIGEHKVSFEANAILSAANWPNVVQMVSRSVFRRLENERDTKNLIQKMNAKLDLGVSAKTIDAAVPYFELRHLLVHADGKADRRFCDSYPAFGATEGSRIPLHSDLLHNARNAIFKLVNEFDEKVISKNVVAPTELQP